jgi:hypothetical protein
MLQQQHVHEIARLTIVAPTVDHLALQPPLQVQRLAVWHAPEVPHAHINA